MSASAATTEAEAGLRLVRIVEKFSMVGKMSCSAIEGRPD
jgi:hypothetical protein